MSKLPKVAARYRRDADGAVNESVRADLLGRAEEYEQRVVQHLVDAMK